MNPQLVMKLVEKYKPMITNLVGKMARQRKTMLLLERNARK